jgi:hypothetical protein
MQSSFRNVRNRLEAFYISSLFESNDDAAILQWNSNNSQPKYNTRSSFDEVRLYNFRDKLKDLGDKRLIVFAQPTSNLGKESILII